ncbi:MAG: hypothetical protein Q7U59_05720 [Lutibacter sp.]|nr:hypothetical protein [Lutibacter sp.]
MIIKKTEVRSRKSEVRSRKTEDGRNTHPDNSIGTKVRISKQK